MSELIKQINLLYVEDDESVRTVFSRALENKVKNLYVATNGEEGYEKFLEHKPDIVLTDIKMPKLNGIDMSRKIKNIDSNVPIIIMSAHSESGYFLESIEIGIDAYILKPIDKTRLLSVLGAHAKVVLYEKEQEKNLRLINAVVDIQPSIIFLLNDTKEALFANKLFFELFCDNNPLCLLYEELKKNKNVLLEEDNEIFWIDHIFQNPNKNLKIKLVQDESHLEFLVKTKLIKKVHNELNIVVITLYELQN